jgi:hypothetical protein
MNLHSQGDVVSSNEPEDEAFPQNQFYAVQTWYLVSADAINPDGNYPISAILEGVFTNQNQERIVFTPLFTDEDLASRYKDLIAQDGGEYRVKCAANLEQVYRLVLNLIEEGVTLIAFDPGDHNVNINHIVAILRGILKAIRVAGQE